MLTKSPDNVCSGEQWSAEGYTTLCKTNLARSYSVAGSFLETESEMDKPRNLQQEQQDQQFGTFNSGKYTVSIPNDENGIKLGKAFRISIKTASPSDSATFSITLNAVSYKGDMIRGLKAIKGQGKELVLTVSEADWGHDWLKTYVPARTITFEILVSGEGTTTGIFFKKTMVTASLPRLAMLCGAKERKTGGKVACNVQFKNPLPYSLTNAVMSFSISGQSSQQEQSTKTFQDANQSTVPREVGNGSRSSFTGKFSLAGALGSQVIIAKLSTKELDGVSGAMIINVTP
jgi:hypothetical protein